MTSTNLINVVIPPLPQPFTYEFPEELADQFQIGLKVLVPFGKRKIAGFVVSKVQNPEEPKKFKLKQVERLISTYRCFESNQLEFFQWVADYYGDPLSNVIDAAVPPLAQGKEQRFVKLIQAEPVLKGRMQQEIVTLLKASEEATMDYAEIIKRHRGAAAAIKNLCAKGVITCEGVGLEAQKIFTTPIPDWAKKEVVLNQFQYECVSTIRNEMLNRRFQTYLLHGITGSGKTEVYLELIKEAQAQGMGALLIVPEIALTPQLIDRFRARLGDQLAVLHSGLKKRFRWQSWQNLLSQRCLVAIGARSGIFAPVSNLGLIIVDEEHESSYKQSDGLRYNARDLAVVRGKLSQCPVILGSATPSLESFHHAAEGKYNYLSLPTRPKTASPVHIELVDLNRVKPWEMVSKNISPVLYEALRNTLSSNQQSFILYNRRGFASYLQCEQCEHVLLCSHCSVTLTYHQNNNSLRCHYCNLTRVPPVYCPLCLAKDVEAKQAGLADSDSKPGKLTQRGAGTEKIFDELQSLFPGVVIDRLDRDAAQDELTYRSILQRVREGHTQILVGTQMIAKGHDLPGVTLVGIADCDVGLHMPDFRAGERVFHLLTQAAGRAGRGENPGRVILQTRVPSHLSLTKTLTQDYRGFAEQELKNRRSLTYPPFCRILRVVASSEEQHAGGDFLGLLKKRSVAFISQNKLQASIMGPCPAPLQRLKAQWRWHMIFKSKSITNLRKVMEALRTECKQSKKIKVIFDLDPQEMM